MIEENNSQLKRSIDWKQGLFIALGVPLLILPSIGTFANYAWGFSIIVWILSVVQGFMQNMAYGELAVMFPGASGLPGYAQTVFKGNNDNKYNISSFIGGFSAWSYWFAWAPAMAIFSLLIGSYLHGLIPALNKVSEFKISLVAGVVIFVLLIIVNYRGVSNGAKLGNILAIFSLAPLIIISMAPFFTGDFNFSNISMSWLPPSWTWDFKHIMILLGVFAMAQWSACAWETAAIYGPEYKDPKTDVPKALFVCGTICLFTFGVVQASCVGTIGIEGILQDPNSPMLTLSKQTFGLIGGYISVLMLIAAMILIIQTAFLGSSRAMHSMASEGNLPKIFGKSNKFGTPIFAMVVIAIFNIFFICLRTPTAIIAASSIGYVFANGISLFAYVVSYKDERFKNRFRPFKAPKGWNRVALIFGIFNLPLCLLGVIYLNSLDMGWASTIVGFFVLAGYIPLWCYSKVEK
ncbi:APC family permease [Wukongibacter baidiensis]|uniref:APC family permease n=1 Tax=Wukongibacter baidiensis TaxID=1723361 RepID=UPI003D7F437B